MYSFNAGYTQQCYAVSSPPAQMPMQESANYHTAPPSYYSEDHSSFSMHSDIYNASTLPAMLGPDVNSYQTTYAFPNAPVLRAHDGKRSCQQNVAQPSLSWTGPVPGYDTSSNSVMTSAPVEQSQVVKTATAIRYRGERMMTKFGQKNALIYRIPGTRVAYTFTMYRKNKNNDVYRCCFCKSAGVCTTVKVIDDDFLTDPSSIGHQCSPRAHAEESVKRMLYQKMSDIRTEEHFVHESPRRLWMRGMQEIKTDAANEESVKEELLAEYYLHGFGNRKRQFSRNLAIHKDKRATMAFIPEDLQKDASGNAFLQERDSDFHIYYSMETIQKASRVGIQAIVADGVHTPQPKELGPHSQLYCVHAVCDGGIEVTLMYAITAKKTQRVYARIFEHLRRSMEHNGCAEAGTVLRIILDFEKAAINAARSSFPNAKIEGCAFHLAQAWNRKMTALGLQQHVKGSTRDRRISRWWNLIKGVVFLPNELRTELRALRHPPVPRSHIAYQKCADFIRYLKSTWLNGPFKYLWCKWKISTLRTTNLAEAFHSMLKGLLKCDHPELATLITVLRELNTEHNCLLTLKIMRPDEMKRLRRRDAERRLLIDEAISRFAGRYHTRGVTTREVRKFCSKMSRHTTRKTV